MNPHPPPAPQELLEHSALDIHPIADRFPLLSEAELAKLARDIEDNGLLEPIVIWQGQLIDGRNRLAACRLLDIEPPTREWEGDEDDLVRWIISKNILRRHLTPGQRAELIVECNEVLARGQNARWADASAMTQAEMAEMADVSVPTIKRAVARERKKADPPPEEGSTDPSSPPESGFPGGEEPAGPSQQDNASNPPEDGSVDPSSGPQPSSNHAPLPEEDAVVVAEAIGRLVEHPEALRTALAGVSPKVVRAAVRAPRKARDAYYTPMALAVRILDQLGELEGYSVLEPSVGEGAFALAAAFAGANVTALDLDPHPPFEKYAADDDFDFHPGTDFLSWEPDQAYDFVIGNPPYADAEAHVRKAYACLKPGGRVVFLLRLGFLASLERADLFCETRLERVRVVRPRPSFTGDGGTDGSEYAVFIWHEVDGPIARPGCEPEFRASLAGLDPRAP